MTVIRDYGPKHFFRANIWIIIGGLTAASSTLFPRLSIATGVLALTALLILVRPVISPYIVSASLVLSPNLSFAGPLETLRFDELLLVISLVSLLLRPNAWKLIQGLLRSPDAVWLGLYTVFVCFTVVVTLFTSGLELVVPKTILRTAELFAYLLLFYIAGFNSPRRILHAQVIFSLVPIIAGILQYMDVSGIEGFLDSYYPNPNGFPTSTLRATGTFDGNPNYFGLYAGVIFIICCSLSLQRRRLTKLPVVTISAGFIAIIGLWTSQSRGAMMATMSGLMLLLIIQKRLIVQSSLIIVGIVIGFVYREVLWLNLAFIRGSDGALIDRFDSVTLRLQMWKEALTTVFWSSPIVGFGLSDVDLVTDNSFVSVVAQGGIIGLVLFLSFAFIQFQTLTHRALRAKWKNSAALTSAACICVLTAVHALTANSFFANRYIELAWSLVGLGIAEWMNSSHPAHKRTQSEVRSKE